MEKEFWLERWRQDQIGFHQADINPRLRTYWPALRLPPGSTVFVPLCGKSRDMSWLVDQGHRVIGVELASVAVTAFFADAAAPYEKSQEPPFDVYDAGAIRIYCGNLFDLGAAELVNTAGVFDRGALVALPAPLRERYVDHLLSVLPAGAAMLLLTIEYDQQRVSGPPFSVTPEEVTQRYGARCAITRLEASVATPVPPHFRQAGIETANESTYHIVKER